MALIAALVVPGTARGQATLTLEDVVDAALLHHPAAELGRAAVAGAGAAAREAAALQIPSLGADASLNRFQEPMVVAPLHGFDPQHPPVFDRTLIQGSVGISYLLFDGGARGARVARSSAGLDGARARQEALTQALMADVVRRYAAVLVARELEAAHAGRVEALERERDRASRLLREGRAARVVLLRAEAALSGARAELAGTSAGVVSAERELARLMGVGETAVRSARLEPVTASDPLPSRDEAVARAVRSNPELSRLAAERAASDAGVAEAGARWWPQVQLGGRYVHYASAAGSGSGEWQSGVQLSYPLFTGGARPAAVERARAASRAAAAEVWLAELQVADAVDRALAAVESAGARSVAWQAAVEQSAEVVRIERLALDTGGGVQTDYLNAESELLRARASLTEARYAELVARAELARALGVLDGDWIARAARSEP
ncbi:MAG TPA: TolC family protein [Longimicrobiales bacterium]|nr:TolC family protein [Longimicrobiales bacterium]